jgi:hypothetical protein
MGVAISLSREIPSNHTGVVIHPFRRDNSLDAVWIISISIRSNEHILSEVANNIIIKQFLLNCARLLL